MGELTVWLGCSDSRCPETTILGLQPGDVFVHRNIANIVSPTDVNTAAVIEYAVVHLRVKHVVVCGHSECGGAKAAVAGNPVGGVLDLWLTPLRALRAAHAEELDALPDDGRRALRIAELNVAAGVNVLMANPAVRDAIELRGLQVHGTVFDIASGRVRDLGIGTCKKGASAGADALAEAGAVVRGRHARLVFRGDGAASMQASA